MNNRWTRWLAIAAVALSIVALVFLAFYPCTIQSVSTRTRVEGGPNLQAPIVESECFSLLESQGLGILAVLSIPVGLTLLGVAGAHFRQPAVVWFAALTALVFALLTGFSVGLFYIPSVGLLVVSAISQHLLRPRDRRR